MSSAGSQRTDEVRVVRAEFEAGAPTTAGLPIETCEEVGFVGRSNVGKSSLMNALLGRKNLVRTSSTPGCTRQINLFDVELKGGRKLRLVDLPGYGYAKLSKAERASWGARLEEYVQTRAALSCVVLLVDARRGFESDDAQMAEFILAERPAGPPPRLIVVATKIDKLPKARWRPGLTGIAVAAARPVLGFSAVTGEGRGALWARLLGSPEGVPSLASSAGVG
jgi:GTP-binding protein